MVSLQLLLKQEECLTKASHPSAPWPTLELWVAWCWEMAAGLFLGWKGLWLLIVSCFPATFWAQSLLTLLLIIATKRNLPSFGFAYFVFSKVHVVMSFMAETRSISRCRHTSFMKFPFRGNSDGWALMMQRFQVRDNHYLVLCMKKKSYHTTPERRQNFPITIHGIWILVILLRDWLTLSLLTEPRWRKGIHEGIDGLSRCIHW